MIKSIVTIMPTGTAIWPEIGMTHRTIVTRSSLDRVKRAALIMANGKPVRIEAFDANAFYMPKAPTVIYLNIPK
jgi:hypothetical protein